ncbi:MAG: NAD-binding protein, partial [Spirochaetota bacterium]|nr:NAD-binding protein [Spirochaetota bacterium]
HFIHADPSQHTTLENIQAHKAKSVILLTDPESADSDAKNALIALAIKHLETEKKVDVYIISELENLDKKRHLMEAGVDEVICNLDFNIGIIAQSALFKNMSQVYQQLLSYSNETNEIYFIPPGKYPAEFIGKDFPALAIMINEKRVNFDDNPLILLGIKQGEDILLNPSKANFSGLHLDDSLIIMAFQYISEIRMKPKS